VNDVVAFVHGNVTQPARVDIYYCPFFQVQASAAHALVHNAHLHK